MALFRLRSQHTGQVREFSLLDVLNALGDPVNDEIRFPDGNREDVYNLSSFQDLSGDYSGGQGTGGNSGNSNATKLINEALPISNGQQAINLGSAPVSLCLLFLNGLKLRQGIDYNKSGRTIMLLNPLRITPTHTDLLEALYDASIL